MAGNWTSSTDIDTPVGMVILPKTFISFVVLVAIVLIAIAVERIFHIITERMEDSDSDVSEFTRNLLRIKIELIFGAQLLGFGQVKGKQRKFTKDERKAIAFKLARQWRDYVRKVNKERQEAARNDGFPLTDKAGGREGKEQVAAPPASGANKEAKATAPDQRAVLPG